MPRDRTSASTRNLVAKTTDILRERIFAAEPGALIGSLHELARSLDVGIVTLQQVARVLEHEGLLEVRRGPGGGYFGARPDEAALERALHSYMRLNPATFEEALDMTSLLFNELATAAASCRDEALREELRVLSTRLPVGASQEIATFEVEFQELLFRMVRRPLFEMLTRVTLQYSTSQEGRRIHRYGNGLTHWSEGRARIINAILANDPELTKFEANRQNRAMVLAHLHGARGEA
ncbi:DNA-binding FadR family transcriptional regulator [Novosphingobium chloroacetimidivorans]|uniref:DNA-binding FadR family transcriptional regulator n=1 Tax=Novosphingobium chloroacetimidivorans TaxID=1428314 RepID=A0A7W7KA89_9SPHN|nr:Rrf2 family transcriptional regulator [Novosphingobium chloroacetimidivorans]MBB4858870.1 DNA-binding FadR family transcriptional regulator [Novosphingobium chloroacetimidivorans]